MDGKERRDFEEALAKAFPERVQLEMMVKHEMTVELNKICAEKVNLVVTIFQLCSWAEAHDKLEALLVAARKGNPDNLALRALAERRSPAQQESSPPSEETKRGPEPDERVRLRDFSAFLQELEAELTAMLTRSPAAHAALANKLGLDGKRISARETAGALMHKTAGKDVIIALNSADEALKGDATKAHERRALKQMMLYVLPAATDFRHYVAEARAKLRAGAPHVDLPLGTKTLAEAILAGVDCRPCRFVESGPRGPMGDALVPMPVAAEAFFDGGRKKGARFIESLVGLFAIHVLHLAPDERELRDHEHMCQLVNDQLDYYRESPREYHPRWFLVDERVLDQFRAHAGDGSEPCLQEAVMVIRGALPALRVARLGRVLPGEHTFALHIGELFGQPT